ncbi:hypothetical protein TSUD_136460 [Trifolium subterraneum]|uniref:Uncharacterized protein n=1 Tax=Trifolium subterraneum TaxID=3900 RepID=A0A2Z6NYS0_TRISU|nr:hypothetical protein TSUD_136460 [Trifolium subterraneum]
MRNSITVKLRGIVDGLLILRINCDPYPIPWLNMSKFKLEDRVMKGNFILGKKGKEKNCLLNN